MELQSKVLDLYKVIKERFYLGRDDLEVGGDRYNSSLLFGVMTELNSGNQLLFGEYGGGKTTSAEYLHTLFTPLPLDLIKRVKFRANPQTTKEHYVGMPDYGALNKGERKVIWQPFVLVRPKLIDEINRMPEHSQSTVLDGVDTGDWDYMGECIMTGMEALFATLNYEDRGNNSIIPPLMDRFDVATESKYPGVANEDAISEDYFGAKNRILLSRAQTQQALNIMDSGKSAEDIMKELRNVSENYLGELSSRGITAMSEDDKQRFYHLNE